MMHASTAVFPRLRPPRRPLGVGAAASIALHALALAVVALFIHGAPPRLPPPRVILTLDLAPVPRAVPAPMEAAATAPQAVAPPPKLLPLPRPMPGPARASAPRPQATHTTPPAQPAPAAPAPVQPAVPAPAVAPIPAVPQGGTVVGHRVDAAYKARLERAIGEHLRYPRSAARSGREGVALVQVRMQRDGRIDGVVLVKSSGVSALDDEAQQVFRRMGRLPPLPADFLPQAAAFEFEVPIAFRLVEGGAR